MQITVINYGLSDPSRQSLCLDIPPLSAVRIVLELMNIPLERIFIVNGTIAYLDQVLEDGDECCIFPLLAGG